MIGCVVFFQTEIKEMATKAHQYYIENVKNAEAVHWQMEKPGLPILGSRVTVGPDMDDTLRACVTERGTSVQQNKKSGVLLLASINF